MKIGNVDPALAASRELMKILQDGNQKAMDMTKKLIKVAHSDKALQNETEGKGGQIDLTA